MFHEYSEGTFGGVRQNIFLEDIEFEGTFCLDQYGVSRIYRMVLSPLPPQKNLILL